jgi:hypothetical protein
MGICKQTGLIGSVLLGRRLTTSAYRFVAVYIIVRSTAAIQGLIIDPFQSGPPAWARSPATSVNTFQRVQSYHGKVFPIYDFSYSVVGMANVQKAAW